VRKSAEYITLSPKNVLKGKLDVVVAGNVCDAGE
jgi:hypothetical protein